MLTYLLLSREDNRSRVHELRAVFNAVRYGVKDGNQWRLMPNDLPPWRVVYQQMRFWMAADVFELLVADAQSPLREFGGRRGQPTAICIDSRTLQSTPEQEPLNPHLHQVQRYSCRSHLFRECGNPSAIASSPRRYINPVRGVHIGGTWGCFGRGEGTAWIRLQVSVSFLNICRKRRN